VWDYPRPPRLEAARRVVRVVFEGKTIAESGEALRVLETASPPVYYLPRDAIASGLLTGSDLESFCEWKGMARYHHLEGETRRVENAGWSYPSPDPTFAALRDYIAFYPGRVGPQGSSEDPDADGCFLGDERVRPQEGPFYGGWVTDDIKGPFKGSRGTEGW